MSLTWHSASTHTAGSVTLDSTYQQRSSFASALQTAMNNAIAGANPFAVSSVIDTGQLIISCSEGSFSAVNTEPFSSYSGFGDSISSGTYVTGSEYPSFMYRSLYAIPEPLPEYAIKIESEETDNGRMAGRLVMIEPVQTINLRYGPTGFSSGSTWTNLSAFVHNLLAAGRFTLYRSHQDTALFNVITGSVNVDGRSYCVLDKDGYEQARIFLTENANVHGSIQFTARIITGGYTIPRGKTR